MWVVSQFAQNRGASSRSTSTPDTWRVRDDRPRPPTRPSRRVSAPRRSMFTRLERYSTPSRDSATASEQPVERSEEEDAGERRQATRRSRCGGPSGSRRRARTSSRNHTLATTITESTTARHPVSRPVMVSRNRTTMSAAQTPVIWVRAPLVTAVPVRLRLPHTLMPPLSPAPMLAMTATEELGVGVDPVVARDWRRYAPPTAPRPRRPRPPPSRRGRWATDPAPRDRGRPNVGNPDGTDPITSTL
jgi:hypothetical protein